MSIRPDVRFFEGRCFCFDFICSLLFRLAMPPFESKASSSFNEIESPLEAF